MSGKFFKMMMSSERSITMGIEYEVYLLENNDPVEDEDIIGGFIENFDDNIYRDYYPYQLEIRTEPHNTPDELYRELIRRIKEVYSVARECQLQILPVSSYPGCMFNGMHMHITTKHNSTPESLTKLGMAIYPYAITLNRLLMSSPRQNTLETNTECSVYSYRLIDSSHICMLPVCSDPIAAYEYIITKSCRYYDVTINYHKDNDRHRKKSVETLEIRLFDVCPFKDALKTVIYAMFYIAERINVHKMLEYYGKLSTTYISSDFEDKARMHSTFPVDYYNYIVHLTLPELLYYIDGELYHKYCRDQPAISDFIDKNTFRLKYDKLLDNSFPI